VLLPLQQPSAGAGARVSGGIDPRHRRATVKAHLHAAPFVIVRNAGGGVSVGLCCTPFGHVEVLKIDAACAGDLPAFQPADQRSNEVHD
jgi:hypothetical protein